MEIILASQWYEALMQIVVLNALNITSVMPSLGHHIQNSVGSIRALIMEEYQIRQLMSDFVEVSEKHR